MRIAITSNGPGEVAGWVRPLVAALLRLAPDTAVTLFCVPDDYATGREAAYVQRLFPTIRVVPPAEYVRFALGGRAALASRGADVVQYLGGDLLHASRVRARLGGAARTYKFASKRVGPRLDRAYALDERNAADLRRAGVASERVRVVGNLAVDGALAEAAGAFSASGTDTGAAADGVLLMPGTRRHEIASVVPLFVALASHLRRLRPALPIAFAISPFTPDDELERALRTRGETRTVWGARGALVRAGDGLVLEAENGSRFPVVRDAMRHAARALFAVTLPGTKCIELAALGVPAIVCVPLNAPEVVVINGPLQYVDRIPLIGTALKRQMVIAVDARFPFTAQPNIDTGEELMPELRGTQMPGEMARRVAAYADEAVTRTLAARRLRELYSAHAGAAERMARSLLEAHA